MSFERKPVIFRDSVDHSFGEDSVEDVYVIGDLITLEIYEGCEWVFRYVTGRTADGNLIVDLAKCKRFDLTMRVPDAIPIDDILTMTVFEIAKVFSENKKGLR